MDEERFAEVANCVGGQPEFLHLKRACLFKILTLHVLIRAYCSHYNLLIPLLHLLLALCSLDLNKMFSIRLLLAFVAIFALFNVFNAEVSINALLWSVCILASSQTRFNPCPDFLILSLFSPTGR